MTGKNEEGVRHNTFRLKVALGEPREVPSQPYAIDQHNLGLRADPNQGILIVALLDLTPLFWSNWQNGLIRKRLAL